jgi:Spy/CpxP family protein refolding chaperone
MKNFRGIQTLLWSTFFRLSVSLGLVAVLPACAQNAAGFAWWSNPVMVKEISLTPDQTEKIRQIVRSYRDRLYDARNGIQKAEAELEDLMNDDVMDPNSVKPVIERLATERATSTRLVTEMAIQVRGVLTVDQWRQVVHLWREQQKRKITDTQVAQ